jgi:hypothetical protein
MNPYFYSRIETFHKQMDFLNKIQAKTQMVVSIHIKHTLWQNDLHKMQV